VKDNSEISTIFKGIGTQKIANPKYIMKLLKLKTMISQINKLFSTRVFTFG